MTNEADRGHPTVSEIRSMTRDALAAFVEDAARTMTEQHALAALDNRYCGPAECSTIAQATRLTAFYSVRLKLVGHRATPQAHAVKFVHYLFWADLLRMSTDVRIAPAVRRAIDLQLAGRIAKLTLGEKIATAKRCTRELIKVLLFDPSAKVFEALLVNARLRQEDLLQLLGSDRATVAQLTLVANHHKWGSYYSIRRALVTNPATPRAIAASQLRHLSPGDREMVRQLPTLSVFLRACIERLEEKR